MELNNSPERKNSNEKIETLKKYTYDKNLSELILVMQGHKKATEFLIGDVYPEIKNDEWDMAIQETERILFELGLKFSKKDLVKEYKDEEGSVEYKKLKEYIIATDEKYIREFNNVPEFTNRPEHERNQSDFDLGYLYGFPDSAIKAFGEGENAMISLEFKELPEDIRNEEYMAFASFRLSKTHWQEELELVKKWAEDIKQIDPALYTREVLTYKNHLNI
ncbi:MAG: hypothetical protein QG583_758 [Patescibacteria group bacterium]|nr:hypothetical protein [Patescibacteria group bacterium]